VIEEISGAHWCLSGGALTASNKGKFRNTIFRGTKPGKLRASL